VADVLELLSVLLPLFVLEPVCLTVPEEPVVALFVFEAEVVASSVFEAFGLAVCVAEPELLLFELSFCLTTNASNSGNHLGQGHAAVKVERKSRMRE